MQGHIRKRGKNSWAVVVDSGRDPITGERRQVWRTVRGRKRDAEALLVELIHQRDTGIDVRPERMTVGQFLERWLRDYAEANLAPSTLRRYRQLIYLHLLPALGSIPLTQLRPLHIQACYAQMLAKGLAPRTALHAHRVLREALGHALKWQLIARNPADAVEAPRPSRTEIKTPSVAQLHRLLDAAKATSLGTLVHLAVLTGLRQGELLGLRWDDVDLDEGVLYVRQTAQWLPGKGVVFRPPKTHRSTRPVALSPATVTVLRQHRRAQLKTRIRLGPSYDDHGLVFASPQGFPLDPSNLRRAWRGVIRASGLPPLRFHDLRHAHASLLLQHGVHPKVVSERLGHATVTTTLDTYSHTIPGLQTEAVAQLDETLGLAAPIG